MSSILNKIKPEILIKNVIATLLRFPLPFLFSLLYTIFAINMAHHGFNGKEYLKLINSMLVSISGISLSLSLALFFERAKPNLLLKYITSGVLISLYLITYIFIPEQLNLTYIYSLLIVTFGFHCFIAFSPYIKKGTNLDFWNFNKTIFLRTLTSILYSFVLYIGLSLALLAVNQLFNVDFYNEIYGDLFFIISGIINTLIVLSGIPHDFDTVESDFKYPFPLKVFTVYILLPLIVLYLIILYVYGFKILFLMELPVGWVSYLVLSFAVFGIFAFLLIYPIMKYSENKTLNVFSKYFYYSLFPLITLLFVSIIKRISDYGITENRYYVLLLAVWLCFVSISMIIKKLKPIKLIPISLAIISLLSVVGPWSSFNISKNSQLSILSEILSKYDMLENNFAKRTDKKMSFDDNKKISSIMDYINETHGYSTLQPYFYQNLDTICSDSTKYQNSTNILKLIGLEYINRWQDDSVYNSYIYYSTENTTQILKINGYKYLIDINSYFNGYNYNNKDSVFQSIGHFYIDSVSLNSIFNSENNSVIIILNNTDSINFLLGDLIQNLDKLNIVDKYKVADSLMIIKKQTSNFNVDLLIKNISGNNVSNDTAKNIEITNLNGYLLIK